MKNSSIVGAWSMAVLLWLCCYGSFLSIILLQIRKWNIGMAQKEGRQDRDGLYA